MVRDGAKHSPRVNRLGDRAECLFWRLLTTVDDGGVYYADPLLVRAAVWPAKSYRVADVVRALEEIEHAGLIARWTDRDGVRYLCLLRFRQRLRYPSRKFPAPPFDPDTGEMQLALTGDDPPPEPDPAPKRGGKRSEVKRREGKAGETPASRPDTPPPESFDAWMARLRRAHPAADIDGELRKAMARKGGKVERDWFERHWLGNLSDVVTPGDLRAAAKPKPAAVDPEPDGWRNVIVDTNYGPGGLYEAAGWAELPDNVKEFVRKELDK
ncbi:hypothetical protein OpiT1DRAFT_05288 [Opitutaceae bacterium TAV1]|nr:hypothetical protein OpiT1DRAFT_05288 [Opitutaceae bacterium TAV1]